MKYLKYCLVLLLGVIFISEDVSASTYTNTTNLFENTQTNYLFAMANSQIDNFYTKKFVAFQSDNNYYLVVADSATISANTITFDNSIIFSSIRDSTGSYSYQYSYSIFKESNTIVQANYIVVSNLNFSKSSSSSVFDELKHKKELINIGIFVLGLCFALFVTKERRY